MQRAGEVATCNGQKVRLKVGSNDVVPGCVEESCENETFGHAHSCDEHGSRFEIARVCGTDPSTVRDRWERDQYLHRIAEEDNEGVERKQEEAQRKELYILKRVCKT